MNKILVVALICCGFSIGFILFTSGSKNRIKFKPSPRDTTSVMCFYYSPYLKKDRVNVIIRVGRDTIGFVNIDSTILKKGPMRWHDYYEPYLDSVRDKNNKAMFDSSGKAMIGTFYRPLPVSAIRLDDNRDIDSLLRIIYKK